MAGLTYAFDANAGETPESVAAKRKLADSLASQIFGRAPANVGQGLNAIGQALIARTMRGEADDAQKAGTAQATQDYLKAFPDSSPGLAIPGSAPASPAASTSDKVYSNDEPSPLDPPSGADRQNMIATILGEAGNEPQLGKQAVASVIRTRAVDGGYGGDTPTGVVRAPNQFEPWNTQAGRDRMARAAADPKQAAAADAAISAAYGEGGRAPDDPTGGMTHFWSPGTQAALGRKPPSWAGGETVTIGGHVFNSPDDGGAIPANAQPTEAKLPAAVTPNSQPYIATPDLIKLSSNPWLNDGQRSVVNIMLKQRLEQEQQANDPLRALQIKKAQQETDKSDWEWKPTGRDANGNWAYGWVNSKTQETRDRNMQPVNQASQQPADDPTAGLSGEDYLKAIPKDRADVARKVANGEIDVASLPNRGDYRMKTLADAARFDPTFNPSDYKTRLATRKDFTSGKSAQNITSFNTAIGHLDSLDKSIDKLGNRGSSWYNAATAPISEQTDQNYQTALKEFRTSKQAVIDELTRAFRGSGGNVHDLVEWEKTINETDSPAALHAATKQAIELLHSRIEAVGDQYNRGLGKMNDPVQLLSPKAQAALERLQGGGARSAPVPDQQSGGIDPDALAEARRRGLIK